MKRINAGTIAKRLASTAALLLVVAGCNSDPTGPDTGGTQSPVLPSAERLQLQLDFFDQAGKTETATNQNYFNARVRIAVIQVIAEFILTPPVTAFSLALHTVPSAQPDGSYLWVYTYVKGDEEAQIRLRGTPHGEQVTWELRVSSTESNPPIVDELWFEGETWRDGEGGFWRFHDFNKPGKPIVARLDWDTNGDGEDELVITDLYDNPGDSLSYSVKGSRHSIDFLDVSESMTWFIRWDVADGTGSLRAPDYNGGAEACWDEEQDDVACEPVS